MTAPSLHVLVVEDDPQLRTAICDALGAARLHAVGVADGAAALDHLTFEPAPDAVVLDLRLPVLDGWSLLAWMRREGGLRHVPVVVLSGAPLEHLELVGPFEPAACLRKPAGATELLRTLQQLLGAPRDDGG
ncbi:MAG: response regulator [Planctomycetes bacterium]|nr:response regulator [Planctomycetota bacterium]